MTVKPLRKSVFIDFKAISVVERYAIEIDRIQNIENSDSDLLSATEFASIESDRQSMCDSSDNSQHNPGPSSIISELYQEGMQYSVFRFEMEDHQSSILELLWVNDWQSIHVVLDGDEIGVIPDKRTLIERVEYTLNNKSSLSLQLIERIFGDSEVKIVFNGQPIPGTEADPVERLKTAYGFVYFIGILNLAVGFIAGIFEVQALGPIYIGIEHAFMGALFIVLGYFVQHGSLIAIIIAIIIWVIDTVIIFISTSLTTAPSVNIVVAGHILVLIPMVKGVPAILKLKDHEL